MKKRAETIQGLIADGFALPKTWSLTELEANVDAILASEPMKSILASNTSTFYIFESLDDKFDYESCGFVYARAFYVRSDGKESKSRPPLLKPDGTPPTAGELKGQFGFVTAKLMKGYNFANFAALEKKVLNFMTNLITCSNLLLE
ncbi:hypothetical protein HDU78_010539 [Chytriomyces hyalinus]|nr:hypothetical protein HDU78_010539 [Chytriomyces hyalinus]